MQFSSRWLECHCLVLKFFVHDLLKYGLRNGVVYKIAYFVPENYLDSTKNAMFAAGAGRIGNYESCAWQTLGQGQFRPIQGAAPFIGELQTLTCVAEYKVELVCAAACIVAAIAALKQAHPYETPAYEVYSLSDF